jgi:large subunit ribosomal protein L1
MAEKTSKEAKEKKEAEIVVETAPAKEEQNGADQEVRSNEAEDASQDTTKEVKVTAKAGKRSAKGIKEAAKKAAKVERQRHTSKEKAEEADKKPQQTVTPTRSRLERRGKKFQAAAKLVEKGKQYNLKEAVELAIKTSPTTFDATVELHVNLGVDPRQADQNIRGTVNLPAGTGKPLRVAVFGDVDDVKKAKDAGADVAGADEFLQQLDKGDINFDVLIATPKVMAKLGKYARVLGPKGLMPNPKSGTVAADVAKAVKEAKGGKVEYRVDSTGIVHLGVGKTSFKPEQLLDNIQAILSTIKAAKPASLKGTYVKALYLTTTMGPSIPVLLGEI